MREVERRSSTPRSPLAANLCKLDFMDCNIVYIVTLSAIDWVLNTTNSFCVLGKKTASGNVIKALSRNEQKTSKRRNTSLRSAPVGNARTNHQPGIKP